MTTVQRYRVTCNATPRPYAFCTFNGYRAAGSEAQASAKPCPRCGGPVQVTPPRP